MFSYISNLRSVDKPHFPILMHAWRVIHHGLYTNKYIWYMSSICSHTSCSMWVSELINLQSRNHQAKLMDYSLSGAFTVCNNAFKQQIYKELNLYLRRSNTAWVLSFKSSKIPLVMLKCCCRSVKINKVSMGFLSGNKIMISLSCASWWV